MHPRRVLLLIILAALVVYNIWRHKRAHSTSSFTQTISLNANTPGDTSSAWAAFDHAASLRDAPDADFQAALKQLDAAKAAVPDPNLKVNADALADIRGCTVWLQFYRQSAGKPAGDWKSRSTQHLDTCVHEHVDRAQ